MCGTWGGGFPVLITMLPFLIVCWELCFHGSRGNRIFSPVRLTGIVSTGSCLPVFVSLSLFSALIWLFSNIWITGDGQANMCTPVNPSVIWIKYYKYKKPILLEIFNDIIIIVNKCYANKSHINPMCLFNCLWEYACGEWVNKLWRTVCGSPFF